MPADPCQDLIYGQNRLVYVTLPAGLVTITRYLLLFIAAVTFGRLRVAPVAPLMFAHVPPALVDTCHWNVGAGVPRRRDAECRGLPSVNGPVLRLRGYDRQKHT